MIKDIKGVDLGGGVYPGKTRWMKIDKLKQKISFEFQTNFNTGYYLFNCSAARIENGQYIVLHRIIDAYLIYVQSDYDTVTSKIDLLANGRIVE